MIGGTGGRLHRDYSFLVEIFQQIFAPHKLQKIKHFETIYVTSNYLYN